MLTVLAAAGFIAALVVFVPLLAYGLSALVDWRNWRGPRGGDGQGGARVPRRPGPSVPPPAMAARSPETEHTEPDRGDGTVP